MEKARLEVYRKKKSNIITYPLTQRMVLQIPHLFSDRGLGRVTVNRAVRPVGGSAVSDLQSQAHLPRPGALLVQPRQRSLLMIPSY